MGIQLLAEFRAFEDAIVAMADIHVARSCGGLTELAIDEILVDFARSTRAVLRPQESISPLVDACERECADGWTS
jgi:hypothetical protein